MTTGREPAIEAAIGLSLSRLEAWEKASGIAIFTDDMVLPGLLHAALVLSPHAHARIVRYDVSKALALPGVKAVITGADFERRYMGLVVKDETILAKDTVRYVGEPVAAVAALDIGTARRAAALVEVDYDVLPAVLTIDEAIRPGAPILHPAFADYAKIYDASTCTRPNELAASLIGFGDVEKGFAESDVVVERVYETSAQYHAYLEPSVAVAAVDGRGKVTVWSTTQSVFRTQSNIHECLGIPMAKIRAVTARIGGGFGGRSEATCQPIAVALARKTLRPVKLVLTREEDMIAMRCRHPTRIRMKTGARRDGTLVARACDAWFDGGAYADDTPAVMNFALFFAAGPYRFAHVHLEGHGIYTNKLRSGAFRGFGNPQATFAGESQIDEVAAALGLDPLDLRLKNIMRSGDRWVGGQTIATIALDECIERVAAASRWRERKRVAEGPDGAAGPDEVKHGLGLALTAHISGFLSTSAVVRLMEDGSLALNTGAVDIGQGSDTALAQMCAAGLGLAVEDVNVVVADTDASPYNSGTNASRVTFMVGRAIGQATDSVRKQMFQRAAGLLQSAEEDLELQPGGWVHARGTNRSVSFAEIAAKSIWFADGGGPIVGTGSVMHNEPLDPKHSFSKGFLSFDNVGAFTFGAQVAEVAVDTMTGKVEVVEAWCAHDVGRAINPCAVEGQIQGGFAQGLGYALTEEMIWDATGTLINPQFEDYKIPSTMEVPAAIHALIVEVPDPQHPFGVKGIGEPPLIGAAAVLPNAVAAALGTRLRRLPMTPERVLRALNGGGDGVDG